jgi:hypothetical protein
VNAIASKPGHTPKISDAPRVASTCPAMNSSSTPALYRCKRDRSGRGPACPRRRRRSTRHTLATMCTTSGTTTSATSTGGTWYTARSGACTAS